LEPYECATLAFGGLGQHRIEGIGDKMCTLIHNVLNTDFVTLVQDDDCVKALKIVYDGTDILVKMGVDREIAESMKELFGVSGMCNILGAIKMAKHLRLGPDDNVVTIATDSFDRYYSVIEDLEKRYLETADFVLERWAKDIFHGIGEDNIYDFRTAKDKERLFQQKEKDWLPFGYSKEYIDSMRKQEFWEIEYSKIPDYDKKIKEMRG
ncbi:MAG TPA: pyridoxal-5'-phosphate-dependent protein subunit beta, partial [Clostridia bacterium]|nr:pyridoxal-5'-phosphate-dependent protein subunit beta [Clostridia bacterium]